MNFFVLFNVRPVCLQLPLSRAKQYIFPAIAKFFGQKTAAKNEK